jgi:hypothetical protein
MISQKKQSLQGEEIHVAFLVTSISFLLPLGFYSSSLEDIVFNILLGMK